MLKRESIEFGLHPIMASVLSVAGFMGLSIYLFTKTEYAQYCYSLIALWAVIKYAENSRNDFLKFTYKKKIYLKVRITENIILVLPFVLFLVYKKEFFHALFLIAFSIMSIFFKPYRKVAFILPTPFYKKPFEFIVGFRKWIIGIVLTYVVTGISLMYQNFNLGLFSLGFVFLICLSFYNEPENVFFVWMYKLNARRFLAEKIATATMFATIIALPISLALIIFFKTNIIVVAGVQFLGYCYLSAAILAKYANYPKKMNLPNSILLLLGIVLPVLLAGLIPFFYHQSNKQLKAILT